MTEPAIHLVRLGISESTFFAMFGGKDFLLSSDMLETKYKNSKISHK